MAYEFQIDPTLCALSGGEDYELLFTISQSDYEKILALEDVSIIGHVANEGDSVLITKGGARVPLTAQGWNAFSTPE